MEVLIFLSLEIAILIIKNLLEIAYEVWYPFGHGLSYTTFEYSDIKVIPQDYGASSQDIRLHDKYVYSKECEYTLNYSAEQIMG